MKSNSTYKLSKKATTIFFGLLLFVVPIIWAEEQIPEMAYAISSQRDTLILNDSIIIIHTVCAPICSSCARVYNKEGQEIGRLKPDFKSAFPEAYIKGNRILWRDNDTLDYSPTL